MNFKKIKGYPKYWVFSTGMIYNSEGLLLKQHLHTRGGKRKPGLRVALSHKNKRKFISVHRLVALAFIPNPKNKPTVNHKDGNRLNNRVSNLEWATYSENIIHAYATGLIKKENKQASARRGKDNAQSHPIKLKSKETGIELSFESIQYAQDFLNINYSVAIHQALREPFRTVKGYYVIDNKLVLQA